MKDKEKIYKTNNIYEASFLSTLGHNFLGSETAEEGMGHYQNLTFEETPKLLKEIQSYMNNGPVPVLSFIETYKKLKTVIFEGKPKNV